MRVLWSISQTKKYFPSSTKKLNSLPEFNKVEEVFYITKRPFYIGSNMTHGLVKLFFFLNDYILESPLKMDFDRVDW